MRHVPPPAALQAPPLAWMFPHVPVVVNESDRQPAAAEFCLLSSGESESALFAMYVYTYDELDQWLGGGLEVHLCCIWLERENWDVNKKSPSEASSSWIDVGGADTSFVSSAVGL